MKKQFLILFVALMAFGINKAFAQDAPNLPATIGTLDPTPITATCIENAGPLNPIAGTEYTYTVDVPTPPGGKFFHWFVTTDPQLIATGGTLTELREAGDGTGPHIAGSGTNYNFRTAGTAGRDSVQITWKAFTHDPTQPVLLVIYVEDDNCENDNLEAYLIRPVHAFTLDIANLADDGTVVSNLYETCVSPVETALYVFDDTTGEGEIQFDYGVNYMFFIVTAANFTHSWMPRFQVGGSGLTGSRAITAVDWAYPAGATAGTWVSTAEGTDDVWSGSTPVEASAGSVDADGESIIVRITIANNQHETIVNSEISLAVDGTMYDAGAAVGAEYNTATLADIHHEDVTGQDCPWFDGFENDVVTQVLTPRPDINAVDPEPFVDTDRDI